MELVKLLETDIQRQLLNEILPYAKVEKLMSAMNSANYDWESAEGKEFKKALTEAGKKVIKQLR